MILAHGKKRAAIFSSTMFTPSLWESVHSGIANKKALNNQGFNK